MENRKTIIRQISQSLDMAVYRREILAWTIGVALGLIYGLARFRDYEMEVFLTFLGIVLVIVTPLLGISAYRIYRLLREPEEYFFTRAKLVSPHQKNGFHHGLCFTVIIQDPEEGTLAADTNPIFFARGFEEPLMEHYLDKTVPIAYNRSTGMVVVLK